MAPLAPSTRRRSAKSCAFSRSIPTRTIAAWSWSACAGRRRRGWRPTPLSFASTWAFGPTGPWSAT